MTQLDASIYVDLDGNVSRNAPRFKRDIERFATDGARRLSFMGRTTAALGRQVDRLGNRVTALVGTGAFVLTGKQVANLSARLNQLGIDAGYNGKKLLQFKRDAQQSIMATAITYGVASDQIIAGVEDIVQKTGDIQFAVDNFDNLAIAIAATSGAGADFGRILAELEKIDIASPEQVRAVLDGLVEQGQQGAFVLKDLAALGERVFAAYGPSNRQQVLEMGAALQVIRAATGSSEQAVTSFEALMRTLKDGAKLKKLYDAGIQVVDAEQLKGGKVQLLAITDIIRSIAEVTKGDEIKLSALIEDSEARKGLSNLLKEFRETGRTASIDKLLGVSGNGTQILEDAADNAKEFNLQLIRLREAWDQFANSNLAGPIGELADAIQNLNQEELQELFERAKTIGKVLAGLFVAYKGIQIASDFKNLVSPGGGRSGNALLNAAGGMTPVPVFVVNNLPGLGGKGGLPGLPGGKKGIAKLGTFGMLKNQQLGNIAAMGAPAILRAAGLVGMAGVAGYGVGTGIYKAIDDTRFGIALSDGIGKLADSFMAALGSEDAKHRLETLNKLQIEITGDDGPRRRTRVRHVSGDSDIEVSGQSMGGL